MKRIVMALASVLLLLMSLTACSSRAGSAGLGAVGGAAAGAGGYEYHLNRQMNQVEEDFRAGRIDQREYDIRKDQIRRDSLLK
jgi:hypothetical protein